MKLAKAVSSLAAVLTLALFLTGGPTSQASDHGPGGEITTYQEEVMWANPGTGQKLRSVYTWSVVREGGEVIRRTGFDQARAHANLMRAQGWVREWTSGVRVVNRVVRT